MTIFKQLFYRQEIILEKKIALLPGDGIGPEVMKEAVKILESISDKFNIGFNKR